MSWFSKNYEKTALGGAAVVALGLGVLGFSKYRSVAETFASSLQGGGNNNTAVLDANLDKAKKSMGHVRAWEQGKAGKRPVDLFTGIPLFIHREGLDKAIDLLTAPAVHSTTASTPVSPILPAATPTATASATWMNSLREPIRTTRNPTRL